MRTLLLLAAASCVLSACAVYDRPVPPEPDYAAHGEYSRGGDRDRDHRSERYDDRDHRSEGNMHDEHQRRYPQDPSARGEYSR